MHTIADIFETLKGPAEVARLLGIKTSTSSEMKRRQTIPVRHWRLLVDECKKRNKRLTFEALVKMHAKPCTGGYP